MDKNKLLIEACKYDHTEVVGLLITAGANVHAVDDYALRWASANGRTEVVRLLLSAGANVHAESDEALRCASSNGHTEVVRLLITAGANVHAEDNFALRRESGKGHTEVVGLLLSAGANVHAADNQALRWASEEGHTEVVRLLLSAGANVHAMDDYALRWASGYGHTEVVRLLVDAGANVHAADDEALRRASENGHTEVVRLLLDTKPGVPSDNQEGSKMKTNKKSNPFMKKIFYKFYYHPYNNGEYENKININFKTYKHIFGQIWFKCMLFLMLLLPYEKIHSQKDNFIHIAVIDTGYDLKSTWIAHREYVPQQICEIKDFTIPEFNTNGQDEVGHGTHIVGLISHDLNKIPGLKYCLHIFRFHNVDTNAYLQALFYLTQSKVKMDYLNMSLSGNNEVKYECEYIEQLQKRGTKVIASAGNDGLNIDIDKRYPASCNTSIYRVMNIDKYNNLSKSSNFTNQHGFKAYGVKQRSLGFNNRMAFMSGTSQSAAHFTASLVIKDFNKKVIERE